MVLNYYGLGAYGDEYDGEDWEYEIDDAQEEEAFVNIQTDYFCQANKDLTKEEKALVKKVFKYVAKDMPDYVTQFCEDNEEDVAYYFEDEAYKDLRDYQDYGNSDIDDYNRLRYNNCK